MPDPIPTPTPEPTPTPSPAPTPTPSPTLAPTPTPTPEPAPQPNQSPKPEPTPAPEPLTAESVKLPEGFEVDQPLMDEFLGVMNNQDLKGADRAQALIDLQNKAMQAMSERAMTQWNQLQETWQEEARKDPDVGGEKLEPTLAKISTLINVHGSPELREIMNQTGAGNNVHVIKFLSKVAAALGESLPTPATTPAGGERSQANIMFPNMK